VPCAAKSFVGFGETNRWLDVLGGSPETTGRAVVQATALVGISGVGRFALAAAIRRQT